MILEVFSVLDKKVAAFNQPLFMRSRGEAIRSFIDAVSAEKSQFAAHAEDYVLMALGSYDDSTGRFTSIEPEAVISAVECLPKGKNGKGGN